VALGLDPKGSGKFVTALEQNLCAIATGNPAAAGSASDPKAAVREHIRLLQKMGAKVRG
jgi:hypothetical protein